MSEADDLIACGVLLPEMTDTGRGVREWPKDAVEWADYRGGGSAYLYGFGEQMGPDGWELYLGPSSLLIEAAEPYPYDLDEDEEMRGTQRVVIPIEAFPGLIERMQFALARRRRAA